MKSHFTAQRSRNWLPHAFGLRARLRAFSFGYRVMPIPNRNGQSPKSSKSAAPASAFARRVGALRVLKDNGFHDFAPRSTTSLTGGGFLADDFGFAGITSGSLWEKKLPARPRSDVRSSTTRAAAPPSACPIPPFRPGMLSPDSSPKPDRLLPSENLCWPELSWNAPARPRIVIMINFIRTPPISGLFARKLHGRAVASPRSIRWKHPPVPTHP